MTWTRIGVYYALALILGGYYFAFEWRPNPELPIRGPRAVQQSRFLPIAREDIHEITLRNTQGAVHAQRNSQNWEVLEPQGAQITSALFASLIETLTADKEVQVVEQSATNLASYGLAQPSATLELQGASGNLLATVFIGDRNPTESAVYARKENSPQVVLLGYSVRYYGELIFEAAGLNKQ